MDEGIKAKFDQLPRGHLFKSIGDDIHGEATPEEPVPPENLTHEDVDTSQSKSEAVGKAKNRTRRIGTMLVLALRA